MKFQEVMNENFAGAIEEGAFIASSQQWLEGLGFAKGNCLPCVSVCRDELTASFVDLVHDVWGSSFDLSALAGMIFAGRTGFGAALAHAPSGERKRYIFFAMAHIGIDEDGKIGKCQRPTQAHDSSACGALVALLNQIESEDVVDLALDPIDIEQSLVRQRLVPNAVADIDLVGLTKLAQQSTLADLETLIGLDIDSATTDYAVFSGVEVHRSDQSDYVWLGEAYAVVDGMRHKM